MPSNYWGRDKEWQKLSRYEKAAAMALMEADSVDGRPDPGSAKNVLGAMINRADKEGTDLGDHVSKRIYQPTIEPSQYARLPKIMALPEFRTLTAMAEKRHSGELQDWVGGATHFLAHEPVMERLQSQDPQKYRSWVNWTGYSKNNGQYANPDGSPVMRDRSHAFLAPEGAHSAHKPLVETATATAAPSDIPGITVASSDTPASDPLMRSVKASAAPTVGPYTNAAAGNMATEEPTLWDILGGGDKLGKARYTNSMSALLTPEVTTPVLPQAAPEDDREFQIAAARQRRQPRAYGA